MYHAAWMHGPARAAVCIVASTRQEGRRQKRGCTMGKQCKQLAAGR